MLSTWLQNFVGVPQKDYELKQISEPEVELGVHVTFKTVQACTVMGVAIIGPVLAACQPGFTAYSVIKMSARCGKMAALVGLAAGPVLTVITAHRTSTEHMTDMCYQLRRHQSQLRVDRLTSTGLCTGYLAGAVLGHSAATLGVFGIVGGVLVSELVDLTGPAQKPTRHQ